MEKDSDAENSTRFVTYWQLLGRVVSAFCVPILLFTIVLPLRIEGAVEWSYWIVFSPIFATLLGFFLATTSQTLSAPAPLGVRILWMAWVISLTMFVVFLVLRLDGSTSLIPSLDLIFSPLYFGLGLMVLVGFCLIVAGCCSSSPHKQKKYIVSAVPICCFAVVLLPLILLISFKQGVDSLPNVSYGVIFIPLFVADMFGFCMGFFLLLFSFGGRKDAIFSIFQLFVFLVAIPVSVTFKILLVLYLDGVLKISLIYVFLPLIVLEALLLTCGLGSLGHRGHQYHPVKIAT